MAGGDSGVSQPASPHCMHSALTPAKIALIKTHCNRLTSLPVLGSEKKCLMGILAVPGPHHRSAWSAVFAYWPLAPVVQICWPTALQQHRRQPSGDAVSS